MHFLARLLGVMFALALTTSLAAADTRVALVIGNGAYSNVTALPNPPNDANDVAAMLEGLGFAVTKAVDLNGREFGDVLSNFRQSAQSADVALFYYAGHGFQFDEENYLMPVDAELRNELSVKRETIGLTEVLAMMEGAGISLVFIDACRDNPLAAALKRSLVKLGRSTAETEGLAPVRVNGRDTLVAFAAAPDQRALDGTGRNSPFTTAVLQHLPTPGIEISTALKRVTSAVRIATGGEQLPEQLTAMAAEFYMDAAAPPVEPATDTASVTALEDRAFDAAMAINTEGAWLAFLEAHSDSPLAPMAQQALAKLRASDGADAPEDVAPEEAPIEVADIPKEVGVPEPPQTRTIKLDLDNIDLSLIPERSISAIVVSEAGVPVTDCDRMAAHPEAHIEGVDGVYYSDFYTLWNAEQPCREALAAYPDEPRFLYQLSRVLSHRISHTDGASGNSSIDNSHPELVAYLERLSNDYIAERDALRTAAAEAGFGPALSELAVEMFYVDHNIAMAMLAAGIRGGSMDALREKAYRAYHLSLTPDNPYGDFKSQFEEATRLGSDEAKTFLLWHDLWPEPKIATALDMYEAGNLSVAGSIGWCYAYCGDENTAEAAKWYSLASELDPDSCRSTGMYYAEKRNNVSKAVDYLMLCFDLPTLASEIWWTATGYEMSKGVVSEMQRRLKAEGYYSGGIDGVAGPGFERAVYDKYFATRLKYDGKTIDREEFAL